MALVLASVPWPPAAGVAAPRVPASREEVLFLVPGSEVGIPGPLRDLRARVRADPGDQVARLELVKGLLELATGTRDEGLVTQAAAFLAPLLRLPSPPVEALVLEAVLLQRDHRFTEALERLDRALATRPDQAAARLVRASVRQATGRFREAAGDCLGVAMRSGALPGAACLGVSAPALGTTTAALQALETALERDPGSSAGVRSWALVILGELEAAAGRPGRAEAAWREALELVPDDPVALGLLADRLIESGRSGEVRSRLSAHARRVDLALRLARAERDLGLEVAASRIAWIRRRLEGRERLPGHERELAYLRLHLLGDPRGALAAAAENFALQQEAIDARLLLEASEAAGDPGSREPVDAWLAARRGSDARFASWTARSP